MRQHQRQRLTAFIERTHHGKAGKRTPSALGPPDPQRHFSPERHHLTEEECRTANALLRKAERERPLHGTIQQIRFRHALRCAGIVSAVRNGRVGSVRFGRSLQGHHGGNIMKAHGLAHLRSIAAIGSLTARVNREKRQAQDHWERTGEVLTIGAKPTATMEQRRIEALNDAWEISTWQTAQLEQLRW